MLAISGNPFRGGVTTTTARAIAIALLLALCAALIIVAAPGATREAVTLALAPAVSLLAGVLVARPPLTVSFHRRGAQQVHARRLDELTATLRRQSKDIDRVVDELAAVATERHSAIEELSNQLSVLSAKEQELRRRNDVLLAASVPAAQEFALLTAEADRRNQRQSYRLFVAGVVVSTVVNTIFYILQSM